MKRINVFDFVQLGMKLAPLKEIDDSAVISDIWVDLWVTRNHIKALLSHDSLNLRTSVAPAKSVIEAINEIVPVTGIGNQDKGKTLVDFQAWNLKRTIDEFVTVLSAELNVIDTYCVSQKGAYSTSDLVDHAEVAFPQTILSKLSKETIAEFNQAGRCLAFDTPTATGFHLSRAIESVIVAYYKKIVNSPVALKTRNWGSYIHNLEKSGKADKKILELLRHIKDSYRNPVAHPEVVLSSDEVIVLFGLSVSAITQMALEL